MNDNETVPNSQAEFAWYLALVNGVMHSVPGADLKDHLDENCPCKPTLEIVKGIPLWQHHSFDGREAFEDEERKPS